MKAETRDLPNPLPPPQEVILYLTVEEATQLRHIMGYQWTIAQTLAGKCPRDFRVEPTRDFMAQVGVALDPHVLPRWWTHKGLA